MQNGMGMRRDSDILNIKDVSALARAYQAGVGAGPSIIDKPWALVFDGALQDVTHSRWNTSIQEQLVTEYFSKNPVRLGVDHDFIRKHFQLRLITLRKLRTAKGKAGADPAAAAAAEEKAALVARQNSARSSVRLPLRIG
jgi:hypothetical protein